MDEPPGLLRYLPWLALLAILFGYGIAWGFALGDVGVIDAMLAARPAEPGAVERSRGNAVPGKPEIHRGRLRVARPVEPDGPVARVAPDGTPAAVFRAWVEPTDDDSDGEFCVTAEHRGLELETAHGAYPLRWLDDDRDLPIFGDPGVVGPSSDATAIDVGPHGDSDVAGFPGPLAGCAGSNRASRMRLIPADAEVEVLACARDGELSPCEGHLANVVATDGLDVHRRRRAGDVGTCFRVAGFIVLAIVVGIGVATRTRAARVFQRLRVSRR